jgi:hypothetical protein
MWSYPEANGAVARPDDSVRGRYEYPADTVARMMDTGVRGPEADDGALVVTIDPSSAEAKAAAAQRTLLKARPYGGSPTAAALDDLYWLFAEDPALDEERANPLRERHVILITDGLPDDDYRGVQCDEISCPYPLAADAARALHDDDIVTKVHVIAFDALPEAVDVLDTIARAGGTEEAVAVVDGDGLKAALQEIVENAR